MGQQANDAPNWKSRLARWVGLAIAATALEGAVWAALRHLGVQRAAEVLLIGSLALLATVCVFAPARWLRHPDIAGPAADHPLLVRAICAGGGVLLCVITYLLCTAP